MDATQKKRMKKVALAHFILSLVCVFSPFFFSTTIAWSGSHGEAYNRALERQAMNMAWNDLINDCGMILQPQYLVLTKILKIQLGNYILLTLPVWSLCFGWLFVKLDNWLNHFPVLGKRVF